MLANQSAAKLVAQPPDVIPQGGVNLVDVFSVHRAKPIETFPVTVQIVEARSSMYQTNTIRS